LAKGLILYDEPTEIIFVKNYLKYNPLENPNQIKAAKGLIESLPITPFILKVLETLSKPFHKPLRNLLERVSERLAEGLANQEQEQEQEQEQLSGADQGMQGGEKNPVASAPSVSTKPDCPISKIVQTYHHLLPDFSQVKILDPTTRKNVKNRWDEDQDRQTLEFWEGFFQRIKDSDFLSGRKTDFKACFSWVMGPKNFVKIMNGFYDNHYGQMSPRSMANANAADAAKRLIAEGKL
jgi:hypothetical protein